MWSKTSRHKRGYGTTWDKIRKHILIRDDNLCQSCLRKGRLTPGNEVDHIIPKAKGGTDDPENLQTICAECHRKKTLEEKGCKQRIEYDVNGNPISGHWWNEY